MGMSKQDFIALADLLKATQPTASGEGYAYTDGLAQGERRHHEYITGKLADFCEQQGKGFKRQRWLEYIAGKVGANGGKAPEAEAKAEPWPAPGMAQNNGALNGRIL